MGENSAIEWTDHTFNPWIGCTKVSPGCDHCYAEKLATARLGVAWGPHAERRRAAESTWRQPLAWNRKAEREGKRARVFCASLADVFDNQVPTEWREDLWSLIHETPHLDWLLLTKRPQNIARMLPEAWGDGWPNVWLGTTVENQAEADRRIPHLRAIPAKVRFLSCEPLLGPMDLTTSLRAFDHCAHDGAAVNGCEGCDGSGGGDCGAVTRSCIGWVIAGGESGPGARSPHPAWFRSLRDQCRDAGVPFFFKQWGEWAPANPKDESAPFPNGWRAMRGHGGRPPAREELYPEAGAAFVAKVGKKAAGALLDGREWREVPHA